MSASSPQSPLESSFLTDSSDLPPQKLDSSSKTLKVSKKHKKSSRNATGNAETDTNDSALFQSTSTSSIDSRLSPPSSPIATINEDDSLPPLSPRRGSGPTPVTPKLKNLRLANQPSSEKLIVSKKRNKSPSIGEEGSDTRPTKSTTSASNLALSQEEISALQIRDDGPFPFSDDEGIVKHKKKKSTRHENATESQRDGLIESSSSLLSTASPKSSRRKSSRRQGIGMSEVASEDRKRHTMSGSSSSSSMPSATSSSSAQSAPILSSSSNKAISSSSKPTEALPTLNLPPPSFSTIAAPPSPTQPSEHTKQLTASLLVDVLRSPHHLALLKQQMVKERCDENLDFWLDTQRLWFAFQLQTIETNAPIEAATVLAHGTSIYNTYLETMSMRALNLPAKVNARLRHAFKAAVPNFPITTSLFVEAQTVSFKVIESDPFPRFLKATGTVSLSPSGISSVLSTSPTTRKEKSEGIKDLIQLSAPAQISSDMEDFLVHLDECNRNTKLKWSKVHDERSSVVFHPKIKKIEHHGIYHLKSQSLYHSSSDPEAIANYIADTQLWSRWLHPGCTILELESISPVTSVVWLGWSSEKGAVKDGSSSSKSAALKEAKHSTSPPSSSSMPTSLLTKKYDRFMVLYVSTRHESNSRSTVLLCGIPHSTAPAPSTATKCNLLTSGFKIEATGPAPDDPISIEMLMRAEKSEFKKWDKDSVVYAEALSNLQNMLR